MDRIDPDIENDPLLDDDETVLDPVEDDAEETEEPDAVAPAEGEAEAPPTESTPPQRQKQTANDRVRQALAAKKQVEEELKRYRDLELQRSQQQAQQPAPKPPQEDPNVLRERLEQMGDVERILWLQQHNAQQQALRDQQFNLQLQIQNDKISFDRLVTSNPQYARYSTQVEQLFHQGLQAGRPQTREEILDKVIGKEARENAAAAMEKAKRAGKQRIQQQTVRPAGARSNVSAGSTKAALSAEETLRRRLEGGEYQF